jgi:hypothetical protein
LCFACEVTEIVPLVSQCLFDTDNTTTREKNQTL